MTTTTTMTMKRNIRFMSKILDHINQQGFDPQAWERRGINVKREGNLLLFKYSSITADFANVLVREARGLILREDRGHYRVVSRPFDKFFNTTETVCQYGPSQLNKILKEEPHRVTIVEKADGTCIQVWYDEDQLDWRASTLGAITPGTASFGGSTFDSLFWNTIGLQSQEARMNAFSRGFTYVFELCRMENMIVTQYPEPRVYILGCRSLGGDVSVGNAYRHLPSNIWHPVMWPTPSSYEDLLHIVETLPEKDILGTNPEGVVVYVDDVPVAKIKNQKYLVLHKIGGGDYPAAMNNIRDAVFDGTYHSFKDDLSPLLLGYLNRMIQARDTFLSKARKYANGAAARYSALKNKHRSELAKIVKSYPDEFSAVLFAMELDAYDPVRATTLADEWLVDRHRYKKLPQFKIPLEECNEASQ